MINDRSNDARDEVPAVEHVLGAVAGRDVEVVVVLDGNADEAGYGVLRSLPKCIGILRCGGLILRVRRLLLSKKRSCSE